MNQPVDVYSNNIHDDNMSDNSTSALPKTLEELPDWEAIKLFVSSIHSCTRCGVCFQNKYEPYFGQYAMCKKCRRRRAKQNRASNLARHDDFIVILMNVVCLDSGFETTQKFLLPRQKLSPELLSSLQALHQTSIHKKTKSSAPLRSSEWVYETPAGKVFHETFDLKPWAISTVPQGYEGEEIEYTIVIEK